jgi:hypothetical protein
MNDKNRDSGCRFARQSDLDFMARCSVWGERGANLRAVRRHATGNCD